LLVADSLPLYDHAAMVFQCPNCQTTLEGSERFCRKCGTRIAPEEVPQARPSAFETPPPARPSAFEAPPPPPVEQAGYYVPPSYEPSAAAYPVPVPQYAPVKRRSKGKIFAIVFAILAVVCGVGGIFIGTKIYQVSQNFSIPDEGGIRWKGEDGEVTFSQPKSADELPADVKDWYFTGAQIMSYVATKDENTSVNVLLMTTTTPLAEIEAFYDERTADLKNVSKTESNGQVRIKFEGGSVDIQGAKGSNQPSTIIVTLGDHTGAPGDESGEFPSIPTPPAPPAPPAPPSS
jgi:hypothetical protein